MFYQYLATLEKRNAPYWITKLFWLDILQCDREMDQVQINVLQAPGFSLSISHLLGLFSVLNLSMNLLSAGRIRVSSLAVVIVPQLRCHENIISLDNTFLDSLLYPESSFLFILVIVCSVKEPVADFDGFINCFGSCILVDFPQPKAYDWHVL